MKYNFLEAIEASTELDDIDKQAVNAIYNTVFGENTPEAKLVDVATEEPPNLAEFETLGEHQGNDISVTEQGMKLKQTLPDGTDVTTIK
jgi:hypothetical protein